MLPVIYLLALSHNYRGWKENNIKNTCDFDIIRIKQNTIQCVDYGEHQKYCRHYSQPNEIMVHNEIGVNGRNIIIKPAAMWETTDYGKYKVADMYYTFICDKKSKSPKLIQHIIPTPQYDMNPIIGIFILSLAIIIIIIICCYCDCDCDISSTDGFLFGYWCGNSRSNYHCE